MPGYRSTAPVPSGSLECLELGTRGSIPSRHMRQSREQEIPVQPTVQRRRSPVPAQGCVEAAQGVVGSTQVLQQRSLPAPVWLTAAEGKGPLKALGSQGEDAELGVPEANVIVEFPCGAERKSWVRALLTRAPRGKGAARHYLAGLGRGCSHRASGTG